jgi:flagellar hook protein FlgE
MIQSLGAALSALSAGQQRMDALANDMANVNTTGYKAAGRASQGAVIETGQPLDLAIEGDGSFQVGRGAIRQGALESSNVDLADTEVGTIVTRTSYAAAVKALHVQDEMWSALLEMRR